MAVATEKKNKIAISETDLTHTRSQCSDFLGKNVRNRAVSNLLGVKIALRFLLENGLKTDVRYSAHNIKKVLEEFDIADIFVDGKRIDVRTVFSSDMLFIPKSHYEYGITPLFYMFVKLDKTLGTGEVLGFLEPSKVEDEKSSEDYYFPDKVNLISLKMFKQKLKKLSPKEYPVRNSAKIRADIIKYEDSFLENKSGFLKNLVDNLSVRKAMIEFENAELLFNKISDSVNDDKSYTDNPLKNKRPKIFSQPSEYYSAEAEKLSQMLELSDKPVAVLDFNSVEVNEQEIIEDTLINNAESDNYIDTQLNSDEIDSLTPEITSPLQTVDEYEVSDLVSEDSEIPELDLFEEQSDLDSDIIQADDSFDIDLKSDENLVLEDVSETDMIIDNSEDLITKVDDLIDTEEVNIESTEVISDLLVEEVLNTDKDEELLNTDSADSSESSVLDETKVESLSEVNSTEKDVQTDLDKLFNSGSAKEAEYFENTDNDEDSEIINQKYVQEDDDVESKMPVSATEIETHSEDEQSLNEQEVPALEEIEDIFDDKDLYIGSEKKQVQLLKNPTIIVGGAIGLLATVGIIGGIMLNNVEVTKFDEDPASKVQVKEIPLESDGNVLPVMPEEMLNKDSAIPTENKEFTVLPPPPVESIIPASEFEIKKTEVSWEVPEIYVNNPANKNALIAAGRKIKLALSNDLLLTDERPTSKKMIIDLTVNQDTLKPAILKLSSGSKAIDKIVLQSVKDILKSSKLSIQGLNSDTGYPALIINF